MTESDKTGRNLRLAREAQGLTQVALAESVGISQSEVANIEAGRRSAQDYLERFSIALDFHPNFFTVEREELDEVPLLSFRARKDQRAYTRKSISAKATFAAALDSLVVSNRNVFDFDIFDVVAPADPTGTALRVRDILGLRRGPIASMVDVLDKLNVAQFGFLDTSKSSVGVSSWILDKPIVLINQVPRSRQRDHWTLAHELGHLLLHKDCDENFVGSNEAEAQANDFASAFLMPPGDFDKFLPKSPNFTLLRQVKQDWHVSLQAILVQMKLRGLLADWQYRDAFKKIGAYGWRTIEPEDNEPESSVTLFEGMNSLVRRGVRIPLLVSSELGMSTQLCAELCPCWNCFVSQEDFF